MSDAAPRQGLTNLVGEVTDEVAILVREEIRLAKGELTQSAKQAARSAALLGGAAVAGHMALAFASIGLWAGLRNVLGAGRAGFAVAGLYGTVAGVLGIQGYRSLREIEGAPRTISTLRQVPPTVTDQA